MSFPYFLRMKHGHLPYLSDSMANLDLLCRLSIHLIARGVQRSLDLSDFLKLGV